MSLNTLFSRYGSDKNTTHSYAEVYEELFDATRFSVKRVLEIGIANGASLFAWRDYFPHASILGIDIQPACMVRGTERISTYCGSQEIRDDIILYVNDEPVTYDLIVDDGCHSLHAQLLSFFYLYPYLNPGGLYVIEDIQDPADLPCWQQLPNAEIYDRRSVKGRYDDILIVIRKPLVQMNVIGREGESWSSSSLPAVIKTAPPGERTHRKRTKRSQREQETILLRSQ